MRHLPVPFFALTAILCAQEPFRASTYLPNDYHNIVHVDFVKLRDCGVWEELEGSALKLLFGMMEQEAGFSLRSLDRLTLVPMPAVPDQDTGAGGRDRQVVVFEGNKELDVPDRVLGSSAYAVETFGSQEVRRRSDWSDEIFFRPRPEVQVQGSTELLQPVLEDGRGPGMPCADIMSLMSGRDGSLFYMVLHLADATLNDRLLKTLFQDTDWPENGAPHYLLLRLLTTGDPDDPNVVVEAVLRHATAGAGIGVTEAAVVALLEKGAAQPQLRLVTPLLQAIERTCDRTDLTLRLDLGRGRTAAGRLAMMLLPLMAFGTAEAPAVAAPAVPVEEEVEVEEPPPPPPPEKKKGEGKGKG